jgi:hypothetical protein
LLLAKFSLQEHKAQNPNKQDIDMSTLIVRIGKQRKDGLEAVAKPLKSGRWLSRMMLGVANKLFGRRPSERRIKPINRMQGGVRMNR